MKRNWCVLAIGAIMVVFSAGALIGCEGKEEPEDAGAAAEKAAEDAGKAIDDAAEELGDNN